MLSLGSALPEGLEVRVLEESADTIYLVLPSASAVGGQGGGSLSEEALEAVSGGGPALTAVLGVFTCGGACGNYSRRVAARETQRGLAPGHDSHRAASLVTLRGMAVDG